MSSSNSSQSKDDDLCNAMRASVAAPLAHAQQTALDALQGRILTQWEVRQLNYLAASNITSGLSAGLLSGGSRHKQRQWQLQLGFAALVFMVLTAVQVTQSDRDTLVDDLLEPDVLALMAMGEL